MALFLLLAAGAGLPVAAQAPASAVRPEFRTPSRSLVTQAIDRSRLAPAPGAVHGEVATAQDLGRRDPAALVDHIQLVLQRPQERQAAFDAEVVALHQHGSPSFHQWLTPEIIGSEFGPSASDLAALTGFLRAEGFSVNAVGKGGMYVDFSGTVAQVEQSFHTEIHNLRLATGEERYSAVREAQMPEALAPLVVGFVRIGNILPRPLVRPWQPPAQVQGKGGGQSRSRPADTEGGSYFVGSQDFYTIYGEMPLIGSSVNGTGVTIALLEQTDINSGDVTQFRNLTGVLPNAPTLTVDHGPGVPGCADPGTNGDEIEAVLDTEWSGAVAPDAALNFVACQNVYISAELAVDENAAQVLSLSYGEAETANGGSDDYILFSALWEQAAAQGQTVVVSSGDAGSANSQDQNQSIASNGLTVNAIGSSAYNVSAGGTDFQDMYNADEGGSYGPGSFWGMTNGPGLSSALSYIPETPWNNTCASSIRNYLDEESASDPNPTPTALCDTGQLLATGGGGGGVSIYQALPTWQTGTVYGTPTTGKRQLPDISLFASNGNWGHALDFYQSDASSSMELAGGTSFVAPQLAGVFALIVQKTGQRLGQPDFVLYNMAGTEYGTASYLPGSTCNGSGASGVGTTTTLPAGTCIFYDIQTGNNSQACSNGSPNCYVDSGNGSYGILSTSTSAPDPAYTSGQGYDEATGLGSVNIANLVNNYQNAADGGISYTPTVTVSAGTSSYTYGHPSSITYTATVAGSGSFSNNFPTGSVTFSGTSPISTIGNDPLVGNCNGSTCTESASQTYTPPGTLPVGSYTITGAYLSTNENYTTGSGTKTLTVNKQTPTVTVTAVTIAVGTATVNFSASVAYTGTGVAPTGGLTFKVDSGTTVTATCIGSSSPVTCTYTGYNTSALAAGSHTITATTIADGNYNAATGTNTLKVQPLPTITFTVANHYTQNTPFTVSATSNSTGAITYSVVSGPATNSGSTVTLTGVAGTVMLLASQAASSSFAAGTQNASFPVIAGSVWLGNGTGSLSSFDLLGAAITGTSGYTGAGVGTIAGPLGLAFDASGSVWVANSNGLSEFTRQGVAVSSTPYTVGGISNPRAVAVDGAGQVWVANASGTVSVLSNAGTAVSPSSGYSGPGSTPAGIAIDNSGSVWIPSSTANTVTRIFGAAAPVAPLATAAATGAGVEP